MSHASSGSRLAGAPQLRLGPANLVLVGPPGAGKTAVGRLFAERHGQEFVDTDELVERASGKTIAQIFEQDGEAEFRRLESGACRQVAEPGNRVIATGGGALIDPGTRLHLEAGGSLVALTASAETLLARLSADGSRPLLKGGSYVERLHSLLAARAAIYDSIAVQIDSTELTPAQVAVRLDSLALPQAEWRLTARQPQPGYQAIGGEDLLPDVRRYLEQAGLWPPYLLVADSNVAALYGAAMRSALDCPLLAIPAGEKHKSPETLARVYQALIRAGVERGGAVVALGGGVTLDLAGYAAATYMRGIRWAALPTTLLAVVDASLGGKVGINLPQGKNLVGAFHSPGLVLADLRTLSTLPEREVRTGLAEIVKAALLGDVELFARMEAGPAWITRDWIRRAMAVKLEVVDRDPQEAGARAALNLGHTFAHALETASGYSVSHGEAVSVGLVAAARLAQTMDRCETDLPERVERLLAGFGLHTRFRGPTPERILEAMAADKKVRDRRPRFVLPVRPGSVEVGVEAREALVASVVKDLTEAV